MAVRRMRVVVKGKVQGVFFRAYTRDQAVLLGLSGTVRNLPDGSVEALIEGEPEAVDRMLSWLRQGSPMADVKKIVTCEQDGTQQFGNFSILY